jgi:uncharacterized protein (TIGR02453 family)
MPTTYFTPGTYRFLVELAANNERPWFEKNKDRYLSEVRDPMLRFIADLAPGLAKISRRFVVDPKPVGGSMMRIYRDVRFSRDKSPYKTAIAAHFVHRDGQPGASPGFYLHLEPRASMLGGGAWRPEPPALQRIRAAIAANPKGWQAATSEKTLGQGAHWHGESLKKAPRGFPEDHPCLEALKRKDFALGIPLDDRAMAGPKALSTALEGYRRLAPTLRFLCRAMGLDF